jgi:isocitrate dehydrogenase
MNNKITVSAGKLNVPDCPIIPFIEGDGIGADIWKAARFVFDSAVDKAYRDKSKIQWLEVFAGDKALEKFHTHLPQKTINAFKEYIVGIKGPLTTPVGGGIRSLNVALRQTLDLYVCLRPVKYYEGIGSPMKHPEKVNMIIFRENTEDIYTGIEFASGSEENEKFLNYLKKQFPERFDKIRFGTLEKENEFLKSSHRPLKHKVEIGIGIKVTSKVGTERLVAEAVKYAIANRRKSVTLVHKGNIMKYTSGAFRDWGYEISERMFSEKIYSMKRWEATRKAQGNAKADQELNVAIEHGKVIIKDSIADNTLQQVLLEPQDFDVLASENLNGDYLSDAIAAQVGGIGIAPGGNINFVTGHAIFEATHGTAPSFAGLDKANPSSLILSGKMMLEYIGWKEAAELIEEGLKKAIKGGRVTFDFAHHMPGSVEVKCSEFAEEIVKNF